MAKEKKTGVKTAAKKPRGGRKPKGPSAEEIQNARFKELEGKIGDVKVVPYRMASQYPQDCKIEHPKFGVGFVTLSLPDKIEVVFQDISRNLVQGRK